jgi:hypothetical protein
MARATTKVELETSGRDEYDRLLALVDSIPVERRTAPGVNGEQSVKDVLAHLHAWHLMFLTWYAEGMSGRPVPIRAAGHTWRDLPALNERIYQEHRDLSLDEVTGRLADSHQRVMKIVESHTDEELFTKKRYPWTGSTSLGAYLVSATASHYVWARDMIRKWLRSA